MRNFILPAFLLLLCSFFASAQLPQLQWANSIGEISDNDMGIKLLPDNNGNLFFYGRFSGTVDFDPGPGIANLTAGGNADIVIGKYNPSGGLIWVKKIGGSIIATNNGHLMVPYDATVDGTGNLYITGLYVGIVDIDPSAASYLLDPPPGIGGERVFVASYTNNGDFRWGFGYGWVDYLGGYWNAGYSIKTDHAGDVVVSGMFHHTCDFDPSAATYELTAHGMYMDIFFAKYSAAGNFIFAKSIYGSGIEDTPTDMIIDSSNNIYLCGYMDMTADFDPSPATASITCNGGGGDLFLAKYNSSGNYQWAFATGDPSGYDVATGLALDHDGNICMMGYFRNTVDFDPSAGTLNLTATGTSNADAFISKYSSAGNMLWAKSFGGVNHENTGSILIDTYGRIIVTGDFPGSCDFDPSPLVESVDVGASPNAVFTAQFDNNGNFLNVMSVNGPDGYLFDHGMVMDDHENLYFTGGFESMVDFDPTAATYNLSAPVSNQDIYMSKYQIGNSGLSGSIWRDDNSNGIKDPGEPALPGIKIELIYDRNNNNLADSYDGIINIASDANGAYEFNFVAAGKYLLRVLPQPGYNNTTPLIFDADLVNGQIINNKSFGFSYIIVPLTCMDFSARHGNNANLLQWKTFAEINSKGFNIQRSTDGINFENIAWIDAVGNAGGTHEYFNVDATMVAGSGYFYRLEEIAQSGDRKFICSVVYVRSAEHENTISIYPNPAEDLVNIIMQEDYSRIVLIDMKGEKIREIPLKPGARLYQLSVKGLAAGIYILRSYSKTGEVGTLKLFKR
ncbi:hypothetical protein BH11BAC4_BH11BAC4_06510 [soil metagenome]